MKGFNNKIDIKLNETKRNENKNIIKLLFLRIFSFRYKRYANKKDPVIQNKI